MSYKEIADEKVKDEQEECICGTKGKEKRIFLVAPNVLLRMRVMFVFRSFKVKHKKFLDSKQIRFLLS